MDGLCISTACISDLSSEEKLYSWKSENGSYTDFLLCWFCSFCSIFLVVVVANALFPSFFPFFPKNARFLSFSAAFLVVFFFFKIIIIKKKGLRYRTSKRNSRTHKTEDRQETRPKKKKKIAINVEDF